MTKDQWQSIATVVDRVLELPPSERDRYINTECSDDPELVEQVLDFMNSISSSEGLWDQLLQSNEILVNDLTSSGELGSTDQPVSAPEQIGPYKIIKCLASGGMGNVFLAERNDGQFDRKVAIKVLKKDLSSKIHIERFIEERKILSGLEHPNIARLYDGGLTDDGRPYLLMEYIDGLPIHRYCRENKLGFSKKLVLFSQICQAVKYAHANLIVHRDLKPDNIFVTRNGKIKVLDFGIAKIVDPDLTESAVLQTRAGSRMMSLQYASPEQITLDKITTASDVYSLGLIFYEILSGKKPYQLTGKRIREAEHIVRHHKPQAPGKAADDPVLARKLKGDLGAIILKALRKEPRERYDSASHLLDDLERYRKRIPVHARKGTLSYKAFKFIKRNQPAMAVAAIFLITATAFAGYHVQKLSEERNVARAEAEKARVVSGFLTGIFKYASPYNQPNSELTALELLDHGSDYIQGNADIQPEIKSSVLATIGGIYELLGSYGEAESLLTEALELEQSSEKIEFGDDYGLAVVHHNLGNLKRSKGDFQGAIDHYRIASLTFEELDLQDYRAGSIGAWGWNEYQMANYIQADSLLQLSLSLNREHNGPESMETAQTLHFIAWLQHDQGNYQKADSLFTAVLSMRRNHYDGDHPEIATSLHSLGWLKYQLNFYEEATSLYDETISMRKTLFNNESHPDIAWSINNLGIIKQAEGNLEEAEQLFSEALQMRREVLPENHPHISQSLGNLGSVYFYREEYNRSIETFREVVDIQREILGANHPNLAMYLNNLATVLSNSNNSEQAIPYYREAIAIQEHHFNSAHATTVQMRSNIAEAFEKISEFGNSEKFRLQNFEALKQEKGIEHSQTQIELNNLIDLYIKWNDPQKTEQYEALVVDSRE